MNNIFLYFTKSKIRWINIPIILSIFLFTCIIILMRFQIHLSNLWFFKHIYTRINCLFCTILIFLSLQSKFKILIFSWLWEIIVSINSLSQRLSKFLSNYLGTFAMIYTSIHKDHLQIYLHLELILLSLHY